MPVRLRRFHVAILIGALTLSGAVLTPSEPVRPGIPDTHAWYVATFGNDANIGHLWNAPFLHISQCAAVMVPGDTCYVEGGTYHETVTPLQSGTADAPITYTVYDTAPVTVTGADPVTGWQKSWGSVYTAPVTLPVAGPHDTGFFANQVFVDGVMMPQARWPNVTSFDPFGGIALVAGDANSNFTTLGNSAIPPIDWTAGGYVHYWPYAGWIARTSPISLSQTSPALVGFPLSSTNGCQNICAAFGSLFYLQGPAQAQDSAGEWVYTNTTHTLNLWSPGGDSPAVHDVEAKRRTWAFDLSAKNHIIVRGFNVFAASISTTVFSSFDAIDGITATFISHFDTIPEDPTFFRPPQVGHWLDSGLVLSGTNNILENSVLRYSAGSGVSLQGSHNTVTNNLITSMDYSGSYGAPIRLAQVDHATVTHNTIHDAARDGISRTAEPNGGLVGSLIAYNDIYNVGKYNEDLGPIYICCGVDGTGTRIAYNWVHDSSVTPIVTANTSAGIYLDNGSGNFQVDHNVGWNNLGWCALFNENNNNGVTLRGNDIFANNTCAGGQTYAIQQNGPPDASIFRNNIEQTIVQLAGGQQHVNPNLTGTTSYLDALHGDYRLATGASAIDGGLVIPGITDGYAGLGPDFGAYEFGGADWIPGCSMPACQDPYTPGRLAP